MTSSQLKTPMHDLLRERSSAQNSTCLTSPQLTCGADKENMHRSTITPFIIRDKPKRLHLKAENAAEKLSCITPKGTLLKNTGLTSL